MKTNKFTKRDAIFNNPIPVIKGFQFNEQVAEVFDDMVSRSVPFYDEIHKIILDIAGRLELDGKRIYDIGCSTGTTISILDTFLKKERDATAHFVGIDNSAPMLKKCQTKLSKKKIRNVELIQGNAEDQKLAKSGMVIMNYTLQFIPVKNRLDILKRIYRSLEKGGVFIYAEKIKAENKAVNELLIDLYYDFKRRNGYSEMEIAQKREALENVLIPHTPEDQLQLLKEAGFKKAETLFRWYNFACFIGIK